jgi:hypothetical protein
MTQKRGYPFRPGTRVVLASPINNELRRGKPGRALLMVKNGAAGVVVGGSSGGSAIVAFDDIGTTVGIAIAAHWLTEEQP